jgi:hypothetical protein
MKNFVCNVLLASILFLCIAGCAAPTDTTLPAADLAVTLAPSQTPMPAKVKESMPIAVMPFYDSQGPQIAVGDYSQRLGNTDLDALNALAQEMADNKAVLTPEEMYVLAIRLYDLGDRDGAVYWYYEAQFRAKLFQQAIEPAQMVRIGEPTFELSTAYDSFQQLAGEYINGYAGCDLDNWVQITTLVISDNPNPPELDQMFPDILFVERTQWQEINNNVATGLAVLANYISENGELIKRQRAQQNMDQYCN